MTGAQWGDEGKGIESYSSNNIKGKFVDMLAGDADIVARCAGGNNAGMWVRPF